MQSSSFFGQAIFIVWRKCNDAKVTLFILNMLYIFRNFYGVDQRIGVGSKQRISHVVSKSDSDHGTATTDNRNLGLTPAFTISCTST